MPTVKQLVTLAEVTLLELGGVEDWTWYSDSLADYGYVKSDDEFEDAENLLQALKAGGVDNWEWFGESRSGLLEYEEYLNSLPDLDDALDVYYWREGEREKENDAKVAEAAVVPVIAEVVVQKRKPKGVADEQVFAHIVSRFGTDRAEDVFDLAVKNGLWKNSTFPKEFKVALKEIVVGVSNPLELAKRKLVSLVAKNGKLDVFLDEITDAESR
jgi:hypothetical protein